MNKVIIIGCPGSGKSYFSKKLSKITNIPLYHLDNIYHNSDGSQIPKDEFDNILRSIFKTDKWIMDGNYQRTIPMRIKECDTVFLLDYPLEICLKGANDRIGTTRDDIPWVETELDKAFEQKILEFRDTKLPHIYEILNENKDKDIIIFKTREEADNYIKNLKV